jgi:hypothetical protein
MLNSACTGEGWWSAFTTFLAASDKAVDGGFSPAMTIGHG